MLGVELIIELAIRLAIKLVIELAIGLITGFENIKKFSTRLIIGPVSIKALSTS